MRSTSLGEPPLVSLLLWSRGGLVIGSRTMLGLVFQAATIRLGHRGGDYQFSLP